MSSQNQLLEFINSLSSGEVFTTRDVLHLVYNRATLDAALSRLVKRGVLERLAYGVFMKAGPNAEEPSIEEIARIKAKAFGRNIIGHVRNHMARYGFAKPAAHVFATDGSSTSFRCKGNVQVVLVKIAARKIRLGDTRTGRALRSMWQIGKKKLSDEAIATVVDADPLDLRAVVQRLLRSVPMWLVRRLRAFAASDREALVSSMPA